MVDKHPHSLQMYHCIHHSTKGCFSPTHILVEPRRVLGESELYTMTDRHPWIKLIPNNCFDGSFSRRNVLVRRVNRHRGTRSGMTILDGSQCKFYNEPIDRALGYTEIVAVPPCFYFNKSWTMHPSTREDSTALSVRLSLDAAFGHANETRLRVCILYNNIIYIKK